MQATSTKSHGTNRPRIEEAHQIMDGRLERTLDRMFSGDVLIRISVKQGIILAVTSSDEQRHSLPDPA